MTIRQSIQIDAPTDRIFAYLLHVDNRKDFVPALEEVILLDPLPLAEGSRYTEVAQIAGQRMETTYQITVLKPNEQLSARTLESVFPIQADLILAAETAGSVLHIQLEFQLSGLFKLASGVIRGIVNQQAKDILRKLKQNLEEDDA